MKIVTAIDSFKGSMTSMEAGLAVTEGVHRVDSDVDVQIRPLADGGEGTVEALVAGMNGMKQEIQVTGPLGTLVVCEYGIIESSKTAVIEMAGAAGITLVPDEKKNPLYTTTYGVGEVIKDAIGKGCRRFIIGIGGSATNDGGIGMLQALGFGFMNKNGQPVSFGARGLEELETITDTYVIPELKECEFRIACDVTNTLCGEQGASAVYGPQKGATPSMIMQMDKWLAYYAALAKEKISESKCKTGRNRSCRRTGIRIFNIYQCSAGIRDQDRTGGDTAGRIYQRCGSGSYGRRKTGQTDGDGKSTDRSSKAG